MGNKKFEKWEKWVLGIFLSALILIMPLDNVNCLYESYPIFISSVIGLTSCIASALGIVFLQSWHQRKLLDEHYSKISGNYIRKDIGQDNTTTENNSNIIEQNIGLKIVLTHHQGEHGFDLEIEYWKNEDARAHGTIEFNETNKIVGSGIYKYYQGDSYKGNFGTMKLFCFEPNKIHVKYQHVFPRKPSDNPDNNRGWEIWEK